MVVFGIEVVEVIAGPGRFGVVDEWFREHVDVCAPSETMKLETPFFTGPSKSICC